MPWKQDWTWRLAPVHQADATTALGRAWGLCQSPQHSHLFEGLQDKQTSALSPFHVQPLHGKPGLPHMGGLVPPTFLGCCGELA